jgi:hypothetical protein
MVPWKWINTPELMRPVALVYRIQKRTLLLKLKFSYNCSLARFAQVGEIRRHVVEMHSGKSLRASEL